MPATYAIRIVALLLMFSISKVYGADGYQQTAKDLLSDEGVQKAISYLAQSRERTRSDLVTLSEIPAPPFKEKARGLKFAAMLREAGLIDVTIDNIGNVLGRRPGRNERKLIAYSAHLDTVFPEGTDVSVSVKGNRMYGPGIGDNAQGLVQVLEIVRALNFGEIETEADILFVANVGEEGLGDLRGIKYLIDNNDIDALIAIDGGSPERIVFGGVGSHRYHVTFKGPGGHSWGAFGTVNPHHVLGRAIEKFITQADPFSAYGETSYSIGRIGGGISVNSIPFESWFEVDMRSTTQINLDRLDAILHHAIAQAVKEENDLALEKNIRRDPIEVDIKRVGKRPAAEGNIKDPLVRQSIAATRAFGFEPKLRLSSTDANYPLSIGIPAVTLSRGGTGGGAHTLEEWLDPSDAYIATQIGLLTLLSASGL